MAEEATKKHLTPSQLAKMIALWESGTVSLADLSEKFDRSPRTIARVLKKVGAVKGARKAEIREKAEEEVRKSVIDDAALLAARIRETKEEHYKVSSALFKLNWAEINRAHREGISMAAISANLKAINVAAQNFKLIREERYTLLGIADENGAGDEIPELPIHELTQDQIDEMRKAPDASEEDFDIGEDADIDEEITT